MNRKFLDRLLGWHPMVAKVGRPDSDAAANGWAAPFAAERFGVGFGWVALASAPLALCQCVDRDAPCRSGPHDATREMEGAVWECCHQ